MVFDREVSTFLLCVRKFPIAEAVMLLKFQYKCLWIEAGKVDINRLLLLLQHLD